MDAFFGYLAGHSIFEENLGGYLVVWSIRDHESSKVHPTLTLSARYLVYNRKQFCFGVDDVLWAMVGFWLQSLLAVDESRSAR